MSAEPRLEVLMVGDLFLELVMSGFESWPRPGEESFARKFHKELGGGAAITACGLAKLGVRTGILGAVGKEDGQWMLDRLNARGVETSLVRVTEAEPTGFSVSVSSSVDRTFLTYNGANRELPAILDDVVRIAKEHGVRHIHVAHAMNPAHLNTSFEAIKGQGLSLSLDVGWHPAWFADARAIDSLRNVDIFFPNEGEAAELTKEVEPRRMLKAFQRLGLERVALKLGAQGAALLWDGEINFQRPSDVDLVDTTGAGDCFDAGFLYAWLREMDPPQCLKAAAACGEMSTRALGGIAGFPSKEELEVVLCAAK